MSINNFIEEMVLSGFASLFDKNPIVFKKYEHSDGVNPLHQIINDKRLGYFKTIERSTKQYCSIKRNSFLFGCQESTKYETIEHLIVGFGIKKQNTTYVNRIYHTLGDSDSVVAPFYLLDEIEKHIAAESGNEVLIFHNHPKSKLNAILDNDPIASTQDREQLMHLKYLSPVAFTKNILNNGTIKFYLGENESVREFTTPAIKRILEIINEFK